MIILSITIPERFIPMLPPFVREFTKSQRDQINTAYQTGGRLVISRSRKQIEGGFVGTLASIGIPMAISLVSKMFGSGLQVDRHTSSNTANVYVPPPPPSIDGEGYHYPYRSPPFYGTWELKKKVQRKRAASWRRSSSRKKQPIQRNSHSRNHFVIKLLSNFDLMDWVAKLGIKNFRGIYSRDGLPRKIRKECGIINLDDITGAGTHWVCHRNLDSVLGKPVVEYFDPFGLIMPNEALKYFRTARKQIVYSID